MSTKPPSRDPAMTLEDVVQAISAMEHLSRQRRQDLCSAVRRIATLQGRRPADIPADVEVIRRQIALFTPVAAGVTPRRWKNVRSLVGIALNLAGATVIRRRAVALSPAWRDLLGRLRERRERDRLSRFAGYLQQQRHSARSGRRRGRRQVRQLAAEEQPHRAPEAGASECLPDMEPRRGRRARLAGGSPGGTG